MKNYLLALKMQCIMYRVSKLNPAFFQVALELRRLTLIRHIEVPLKPQRSHEDFDIYHAHIGHSKLPQDENDCRRVFFFLRPFF